MAKWFEQSVAEWQEFLQQPHVQLAQCQPSPHVVFRGQPRADYGLSPSLVRAASASGSQLTTEQVLGLEEECLEEFKSQAHVYLAPALLQAIPTVVHWWMHMQHFGAPTRLLDWTRSPFVALYFACVQDFEHDGAVWSLDVQLANFSMPAYFRDEPTKRQREQVRRAFCEPHARQQFHLMNMGARNERMIAQQGVFMLCSDPAMPHDQALIRMAERSDDHTRFGKLIIPASLKRKLWLRLRSMNLNARSLFPGLDGLGRSIGELVRFNAFPDLHADDTD